MQTTQKSVHALATAYMYIYVCLSRSEWRRAIGVFLLNGCISLILLNLVYIAAGYSSSLSDQSCFGVSVVFHYIFLVAVCSLAGLVLTNLRQKNKKKSSTKSCMTVSAVTLMTLIWCKFT